MTVIRGTPRGAVAVIWIWAALAGCSSADYAAPIKTFADATAAADKALTDLNATATDRYTAFLAERARTDLHIRVDQDCKSQTVPGQVARCRIVLKDAAEPGKDEFYPPEPLLGKSVALMGDITAYAQNLAALVADDSAAKAATDVNATLGSIEKLANTLAEADGKPKGSVPSFATPVGAAVNWAVGEYAERVKLAGLRQATAAADPVIQRAGGVFAKEAIFGSLPQRNELAAAFSQKFDAFRLNRADQSKLDEAAAAAQRYDQLLLAQPDSTFTAMRQAHAALTDALNKSDISWSEAFAKVQEFAAKAQQLVKIAQDLAALGQKK
jgi:hypothetical protein